ncbi:MAG: hypothetical protein E3J37_05870 [Anaerolineales bacterium]|nr:MAG: hypothetical protein E3J37_05870 [Anaerolineales bacterium]
MNKAEGMMSQTWKFQIDGYVAETADPYLAELIQHLLGKIRDDKRIIIAFLTLIKEGKGVASSDSPENDRLRK